MADLTTILQLVTLLCCAPAVYLFRAAWRARKLSASLGNAEALPIGSLSAYCGTDVEVNISGNALFGSAAELTAPYSKRACVWYRSEVWSHQPRDGRQGNRLKLDLLFVEQSRSSFVLRDRTGEILCRPGDAQPHKPKVTHDSFVPDDAADSGQAEIGPDPNNSYLPEEALFSPGHRYREWSIAPGQQLSVKGVVRCDAGRVAIEGRGDDELFFSPHTRLGIRATNFLRQWVGFTLLPLSGITFLLISLE
ncbi:GIDE domain-containing protein [Actinoalloteichus hymeniacidonis]|uniref:RING-type E3 ubiquitin transferase n=1 Tax=Actinoalloteichus hymeniacidonis TaxID=340345 RepID=A0AAC9HSY9_9PSEU|nr:GIDE domain-containing protein [Actinoalloteichus hymeniacidonis]AOS64893.1 E3 Ubiquitin ligase [Actinoalloteichus hymeniacidonis]MBB5907032.1 hypothetical protein [Actinoalloteichus hymeniacidonis]